MRFFIFTTVLLVLAGCGYRLADTERALPQGVERIHVAIVKNRTLEPFVEDLVTNAVVRELGRRRAVRVVSRSSDAEGILEGRITGYSNKIVAYDPQDEAGEFLVTIRMEALLRRYDDGKVVWRGSLVQQEEYLASDDKLLQEDAEAQAQEEVAQRLAEDLYFRLAEDL